jgi:hypothetical protein
VIETSRSAARHDDPVPFEAHVALLQWFLARRGEIVERIQALLNAQRKPPQSLHDVPLLSRQLDDCFFALTSLTAEQAVLKRQLDEAHWARGFKPRPTPGQHNDLIDPAEMMSRVFHLWQQTRWPGQHGRVQYAHTLFNLYLLRRLMLLAVRVCDVNGGASRCLAQIQDVLDEVWRTAPGQPVLVRDARWLLPLALSPTTNELHGYFEVAEAFAESLPPGDQLAIDCASVRMAGGHLRSQLRHVSTQKGVPLDDHALILSTRRSNALDLAMLIQGLVPLLEAYEHADGERRLALADAILQGISPDPELFLNRLELLGPYSMIEYLFIATSADGQAQYTPMGQRHLQLLDRYRALVGRVSKALHDDCAQWWPVAGSYSPYGVLYGFSSQLLEHMALKASQPAAGTRFTLEDVFVAGAADKLAWVEGWRKLPHVPRAVAKLFDYPQAFAEDVFERIERALRNLVAAKTTAPAQNGRLIVVTGDGAKTDAKTSAALSLPGEFLLSSDPRVAAACGAQTCDEARLLHSRVEGEFVLSYETAGGWVAISKDVLTDVLGAGRDAHLPAPLAAAHVLRLMCPGLVVLY